MMIHDFLVESAQRRPEAPLLVHKGTRTSYGEIEASSNRCARLLRDLGLRRGERVGLLLPNSARYVVSYYAGLKAGAVVVPMHQATDARSLRKLMGDCGAVGLIGGPGTRERIMKATEELPDLRWVLLPADELTPGDPLPAHVRGVPESAEDAMSAEADPRRRGIDLDRATIIYTSGSTGRPRGATLSHLNVVANTRSILAYLQLTSEDRVLQVLPFPYVYGKSLLNTHVAVGGSVVLHDNMVFPETALEAMERVQATSFAGVPATFAILLNRSSLARRRIPSLRYVTQAGGGMPLPHLKRLIEALPGVRIFVMYGATEAAARLSWLEPEMLLSKLGSIGKPIPNVELTIRRDDGTEAEAGETGEIVARGSNIMEGYWGDAEATAEVLDQHGFHTGDLGWRDEEGYLWVAGRKREMIKSGAHRISPKEIEEVLLEHPAVEEAAVVGKPDEYLGEIIVAHITVRLEPAEVRSGPAEVLSESQEVRGEPVTPNAIRLFCQERLPAHKVPQEVRIRDSMPRNPSGKLDKRALREETAG